MHVYESHQYSKAVFNFYKLYNSLYPNKVLSSNLQFLLLQWSIFGPVTRSIVILPVIPFPRNKPSGPCRGGEYDIRDFVYTCVLRVSSASSVTQCSRPNYQIFLLQLERAEFDPFKLTINMVKKTANEDVVCYRF